MKRKHKHLPDCGGRIHESFDRMLARYYGIPMPRLQTSAGMVPLNHNASATGSDSDTP